MMMKRLPITALATAAALWSGCALEEDPELQTLSNATCTIISVTLARVHFSEEYPFYDADYMAEASLVSPFRSEFSNADGEKLFVVLDSGRSRRGVIGARFDTHVVTEVHEEISTEHGGYYISISGAMSNGNFLPSTIQGRSQTVSLDTLIDEGSVSLEVPMRLYAVGDKDEAATGAKAVTAGFSVDAECADWL
jgi:hypothetical protein